MENQDNTALNQNTISHYHFQGTCPNCGYCPHCGRSSYTVQPQFPYWPDYTWPYIVWSGRNPNDTIGSSSLPSIIS